MSSFFATDVDLKSSFCIPPIPAKNAEWDGAPTRYLVAGSILRRDGVGRHPGLQDAGDSGREDESALRGEVIGIGEKGRIVAGKSLIAINVSHTSCDQKISEITLERLDRWIGGDWPRHWSVDEDELDVLLVSGTNDAVKRFDLMGIGIASIQSRLQFSEVGQRHSGKIEVGSSAFVGAVWRVFDGNKEYLVKHFKLNVPSESEKETNSEDWNVVCRGVMSIDKTTSTITINPQ